MSRRRRLLVSCLLTGSALLLATLPGVDVRALVAQHSRKGGVTADRVYGSVLSGFAGQVSSAAVRAIGTQSSPRRSA